MKVNPGDYVWVHSGTIKTLTKVELKISGIITVDDLAYVFNYAGKAYNNRDAYLTELSNEEKTEVLIGKLK